MGNEYSDITGPVYGEEKKTTVYITYGILGGLAIWTLYCVIIAVIYGIKGTWAHFAFAVLMICTFVHLLLSFGLYKKSDQEEGKFLVNCVVCVCIVVLVGIVLNVYVWSLVANGSCSECPAQTNCTTTPQCDPNNNQYLNTVTNTCFTCSNNGTGGNTTKLATTYRQLYGSKLI